MSAPLCRCGHACRLHADDGAACAWCDCQQYRRAGLAVDEFTEAERRREARALVGRLMREARA